ncbi:MAG: hypothetical protein JW915_01060 [Chitinispirillaceae bacterium]|nr:hypothetical protein [Chitinispirillaceae bacterium]
MKKKNVIYKPTDRRSHLSFFLRAFLLTFLTVFFITARAFSQTFTISSSDPSVAGSTLSASSTNQIVYVLAITASGGGANLSQLKFTLTGTYATSDITKIVIKFNTSSDYASSYTASSDLTTIASSGNLNTIGLYTPYVSGTSYIWIIADISSAAAGRTMTVSAISSSNLTFSAGTCTGTSYASGQFTLGVPAVSEDYSTWSYTKTFTLNTSITGANISSNNVNFPVLLRLNPGNFSDFSQTLASGADIRFAKTNGVPLRYAIERWVAIPVIMILQKYG